MTANFHANYHLLPSCRCSTIPNGIRGNLIMRILLSLLSCSSCVYGFTDIASRTLSSSVHAQYYIIIICFSILFTRPVEYANTIARYYTAYLPAEVDRRIQTDMTLKIQRALYSIHNTARLNRYIYMYYMCSHIIINLIHF